MSFGQTDPYQAPQMEPKPSVPRPASVLAAVSITTGLGSLLSAVLFCCGCGILVIPVMGSGGLAAVITGHLALIQFKQNPGKESGFELALIGLIAGYFAVALITLITVLVIVGGAYSAYERSR